MSDHKPKATHEVSEAIGNLIRNNGGPIDGEDTVDGKQYVMVCHDDFDALQQVWKSLTCSCDICVDKALAEIPDQWAMFTKEEVAQGLHKPRDINRCAVCGWPLSATPQEGCVRGNCSMRPRPDRLYDVTRAADESLALEKNIETILDKAEPPTIVRQSDGSIRACDISAIDAAYVGAIDKVIQRTCPDFPGSISK